MTSEAVPLWQFCFPSKESAEEFAIGINQNFPGYFETPEGQSRRFASFFKVAPGAPDNSTVTMYYLAMTAIEQYKSTETETSTTTTMTDKKTDEVMSGHSLMNKRVYARPQTAPPGCKDKTETPLPPSQGSPVLLPKGNSNPGEEKKKQKALVPLPTKSMTATGEAEEPEDLDLDPDMEVWEANRNSPREAVIHVEQETRRPTLATPPPKTAAV